MIIKLDFKKYLRLIIYNYNIIFSILISIGIVDGFNVGKFINE